MRNKIITILLSAAVFLLLMNVAADFFLVKKETRFETDLSASEIEKYFLEALDECGIDIKWIKARPNKDKEQDSTKELFFVRIPKDLHFSVFLNYLGRKLDYKFIRIISTEKRKNQELSVVINSNGIRKLESYLIRDDKISREGGSVSFVISDFSGLSKSNQNTLLKMPYPYAVLVVPDENGAAFLDTLKQYRKEQAVLLNDEISGKKFLLNSNYSNEKIKYSIRNIVSAYKENPLYILDSESDLVKQANFAVVQKEISVKKINFRNLKDLPKLDNSQKEMLKGKLDSILSMPGNKIILIDAEAFLYITENIDRLYRKGYSILFPSENK